MYETTGLHSDIILLKMLRDFLNYLRENLKRKKSKSKIFLTLTSLNLFSS
jgi:hypothetical protein